MTGLAATARTLQADTPLGHHVAPDRVRLEIRVMEEPTPSRQVNMREILSWEF
jgi:hypothetical protein